MKTKPKKITKARLEKIDRILHLSKDGKRLQELENWENACHDALAYALYLKKEIEELLINKNSLDGEISSIENKMDDTIDQFQDRIRDLQRDWARRENDYRRQINRLKAEIAQIKAQPR